MADRYTAFESTAAAYGTDTFTFTANQHDIDVVTEEITPERNHNYPKTSKGRTPRAKLLGPLGWSGNIETLLYTQGAPTLIFYAMGAGATVVDMPTMGVNTHTVTPAEIIPHFIMATGRNVREHQYANCVVTGFSVDFAPGDPVTLNADINSRKELANVAINTTTISFPDYDDAERTFSGVEVVSKIGAAEGGSPTIVTNVESANITYENNFEDQAYGLGDQHLTGKFVNDQDVSGSMEFSFLTITDYDDVVGDTDKEIFFVTTQGTGASERGYTFEINRASYDTTSLPTNNAERYVQTIDFTGTPNAAGDNIKMVLINDETESEFEA